MDPTTEQLQNRLTPTPVQISLPGIGQVFSATGDTQGSSLYVRTASGLQSLDLQTLGQDLVNQKITTAGLTNGTSYKMYDPNGGYTAEYQKAIDSGLGGTINVNASNGTFNVGGNGNFARTAGQDFISSNGISASGTYNLGDVAQQLGQPTRYSGTDYSIWKPTSSSAPTSMTINNTPNSISPLAQTPVNGTTPPVIQPSTPFGSAAAQPDAVGGGPQAGQGPAQPGQPGAIVHPAGTPPGAATPAVSTPDVILQPGSTGNDVKKLQDFLVAQGLMTQAQVSTGYGIYGPQTTAAVQALQQKLGVDNSSGPGFFGPKTIQALKTTGGVGTSGATGTGTAGAGTGASTAQTGSPVPPTTDNGKTPMQNVIDTYTEIYKQLGIGTVKDQFEKTLKDQEETTNKMNDEINVVNDDPWLSQGVRDARVTKIKSKYETKLNTLSNYAKLYDSLYQEGIQQVQFLAGQVQTDNNKAMELAQKKQEALDALSKDNQIITVNGRQVLVNKATGAKIADLGAAPSGSSSNITSDNERALLNQFNSEQIVKDYNVILAKKMSVDKIINAGVGGPGDLAVVYEFMKALDPTSVVRESEYQSAAQSGNIFAGVYAKFNGYLNPQGGTLPPQVKQSFQSIINSKLDVQSTLYKNISDQYKGIATRQGLNPLNVVTDYSAASGGGNTGGGSLPVILTKGTLSDKAFVDQAITKGKFNYATLTDPKNIPAGQIPVLDNATGQPGYIPIGEYTSNAYTKL